MKKILFVLAILGFSINTYAAMDHSGHNMGGGGSSASCMKPHFSKFQPEHLATVSPEAEFSFMTTGVQKPEQIEVFVKSQPVKVTVEDKDSFILVKGKLPENLKNTAARIQVKVNTKIEKCNAEDGWLVNISE